MAFADTRAGLPPCGNCGLPIRGARLRCPRCGELLDQTPVARTSPVVTRSAPPAADDGHTRSTAAIGGAVALVALLWVAWPASEPAPVDRVPPPQTAASPTAAQGS